MDFTRSPPPPEAKRRGNSPLPSRRHKRRCNRRDLAIEEARIAGQLRRSLGWSTGAMNAGPCCWWRSRCLSGRDRRRLGLPRRGWKGLRAPRLPVPRDATRRQHQIILPTRISVTATCRDPRPCRPERWPASRSVTAMQSRQKSRRSVDRVSGLARIEPPQIARNYVRVPVGSRGKVVFFAGIPSSPMW